MRARLTHTAAGQSPEAQTASEPYLGLVERPVRTIGLPSAPVTASTLSSPRTSDGWMNCRLSGTRYMRSFAVSFEAIASAFKFPRFAANTTSSSHQLREKEQQQSSVTIQQLVSVVRGTINNISHSTSSPATLIAAHWSQRQYIAAGQSSEWMITGTRPLNVGI